MTDIVEWLRAYANRTTVIDIKRLDEAAAEIERLRAALKSCIAMLEQLGYTPISKVARAALEGRSCTCHPSEAPTTCQRKYALGECIKAALEAAHDH